MTCASAVALALGAWSCPAAEAREPRRHVEIAASTLPAAIALLAREARVSIGAEGALPVIATPAVSGELTVGEALNRLLAGSGYTARQVGPTAWRIVRAPPPAARPAGAPPPDGEAATPIIVTATKRPIDLFSVPAALSVVQLGDAQRHDPAAGSRDIADRVDGLALTALGPGRNRMFIRGVADSAFTGESQSTVAVVLDEARLTYAAPDPDVRLVDMERVEVLKGPQGSLYGTGTLGGTYRLVTRSPELDRTSITLSSGGSAVAKGGLGYAGSAVANLPVVRDMAALRLVGYASQEPGWVDTGTRKDGDRTRVLGARATLGLMPIEGWRVDLSGFTQQLNSRDSRYVYAPHARSRPDQRPEPHDNDLSHLAARATGSFGAVSATLATAISWHEVGDDYDASVGAESFGLADPQMLLHRRFYRTWDSELRLRGGSTIAWLFGLSHLEARQSIDETLEGAGGASLTVDRDRRTSAESAAYTSVTIPLTTRIDAELGGRLFYATLSEKRDVAATHATREQSRVGLTPSMALTWRPGSDTLLFLRYGSAFRQGGTSVSDAGTIEKLDGDELATAEAGFRQRLPGSGQIEVSAWYTWWSDVQSDTLLTSGLIRTVNAGDARIAGLEASIEIQIAPSWRLESGIDVTNALLTRNALDYELHDRHLPAVPEYAARLAIRHDFALGTADAWIRASARYIGPSRISFDPALDRRMGNVIESGLEFEVRRDRVQFGATATNLFGEAANTFAYGNPLRYLTARQYTPRQPFTVALRAGYSF